MNFWQMAVKRSVDLSGAVIGLVLTSPFMLLIAAAIKLSGPGPVFFRQIRVGKDGRRFWLRKFRTMKVGAAGEGRGLSVERNDVRITPLGRFLRKTSLDELPQLFNVLAGDLALVGPRPALPEHLPYYTDFHRRRLAVRPGLTGLATVNGRASIPWSRRIELDVQYIDTFSLRLDFMILVKTIIVVVRGSGIYYDHQTGPAFDLAALDHPAGAPESAAILAERPRLEKTPSPRP